MNHRERLVLLDDTVLTANIANSAVTTAKIADDAVTAPKIAAGAVGSSELAASAVTTDKLENLAVTEGKLANGAVTNAKIGALAVDTAQLAAGAVTTSKITDYAVTIAKLNDEVMQQVEVTVSSAELLALFTTPKTIVPAPGPTAYIEFISATLWLDYNSAAYAGVDAGEDLVFKLQNAAGPEVSQQVETTGFLDQTSDQVRQCGPSGAYTPLLAQALVLHLLVGNVTTGNSPLKVRVLYRVRQGTW